MDKNEYQTTRIWVKTHQMVRKIAAETGESIVEVLDRLATQESERLKAMKQNEQQVTERWANAMLNEADRKSTRLNSSHQIISYAVFCLKKKKQNVTHK